MKKILSLIVIIIVVLGLGGGIYIMMESKNLKKEEKPNVSEKEKSKTAVIYFSATGTTRTVAEKLKTVTNGMLIEIVPREPYTSADLNYGNDDSRANKEQNDSSARPEIKNQMDLSSYEVIYLGYPIWWGDVPKIILTFLDTYDLSGKTVIPFCTSGGSSIDASLTTLKNYNSSINWKTGKRFHLESETEIRTWIDSLF